MIKKVYLLDTNIVIKIWREYPNLLDEIEKSEEADYKIHQDIAGELCKKEFKEINGTPILSDRFIRLLDHIINDENNSSTETNTDNQFIKYNPNTSMYFVNGNKISVNDYSLIRICKKYRNYILVTEDRKMINSGKDILEPSKVLTFKEFFKELFKIKSQ